MLRADRQRHHRAATGLIEPFLQTFAFAIHKRMWNLAAAKPARAEEAQQRLA